MTAAIEARYSLHMIINTCLNRARDKGDKGHESDSNPFESYSFYIISSERIPDFTQESMLR